MKQRGKSGRNGLRVGNAFSLVGEGTVQHPFSGSRLHGYFSEGGVDRLNLWGVGPLGSIKVQFAQKPLATESRLSPNRLFLQGPGFRMNWFAPPHEAALILSYEGRFSRPCSLRFFTSGHEAHSLRSFFMGNTQAFYEQETEDLTLLLHRRSRTQDGLIRETIVIEALEGKAPSRSDTLFQTLGDPFGPGYPYLDELHKALPNIKNSNLMAQAIHLLHALLANVKRDGRGRFAGISAGMGYSVPARSYYRDAYWTCLGLLPLYPELVREEIVYLAGGVMEDGACPSAVIYPTPVGLRYWERKKQANPDLARDHVSPLAWWDDHFDSPLFFVNMVFDYIASSGRKDILDEPSGDRTIRGKLELILERYRALEDPDGLPLKPLNDRDWMDNVFRDGAVTYDIALYYGALNKASREFPELVHRAERVRRSAAIRLWLEDQGHFAEFVGDHGYREDHLSIETITAVFFGLADETQTERMLKAIRKSLFTKNNSRQVYGDWGIMSVYPLYKVSTKRRGKSRFPYRYHNGADWPYWDALVAWMFFEQASEKKGANSSDLVESGLYALQRAWRYGLDQGWSEVVEYYSPPYGHGSFLQAWSGLGLRAILEGLRSGCL
jgi:hypothetical protein